MVCAESNCVVLLHKHTLTTVGWKEVQLELQTAATVVNIYGYAGLGTDNDKNYIAIDDISINPNICDDLSKFILICFLLKSFHSIICSTPLEKMQ